MYGPINWPNQVYNHSCESMHEIPNATIATCVTSPPYFQLRDYGAKAKSVTKARSTNTSGGSSASSAKSIAFCAPTGRYGSTLGDTHAARRMGPNIPA